jgi:vancomycin resistance protein VanW
VAGKLQEQIGGGLCQISGAIFHLALLSRLEIVERHQHSVDIYTEENRYTPLGTDATVVFGYKDLRIRNPYHFPIQFWFSVEENHFIGELCSKEKIESSALNFEIKNSENQKTVSIIDNGKIISVSHYKNQSL